MKTTCLILKDLIWAITGISISLCFLACESTVKHPAYYKGVPIHQIEAQLDDLLSLWYPRIVDTLSGGYYTNFDYNWNKADEQPKMLVTQARGLWTAAIASRTFPEKAHFSDAAEHGFRFITGQMWDTTTGGYFQFLPDESNDVASYKQVYGNAFAIYAIAEYARINPSDSVRHWLQESVNWLEHSSWDKEFEGYFNTIEVNGSDPKDHVNSDESIGNVAWGNVRGKDQNSSIHLLEALTACIIAHPKNELIRSRLEDMLILVRDTMVGPSGSLGLFFNQDWTPIDHSDSTRAFIIEQIRKDHISFGHDIETAYLLIAASEALYGKADSQTMSVAKALVDHSLKHGFDDDFYGLFDKGYRFGSGEEVEIVDETKVWWAQAEAWHTLALMSDIYPEDDQYQYAFLRMWQYIINELVDPIYGGWYNEGLDNSPDDIKRQKGHIWKGAYHNGRALINVLHYARQANSSNKH